MPNPGGTGPAGRGRVDADVSAGRPHQMTALRSAIVGSGFVARVHAATVRDLGGTVVAVCSRTRAGAELFADEVGDVTAYDSFDDLLRGEAVDVVHVCPPNALHAEQALLALQYGSPAP